MNPQVKEFQQTASQLLAAMLSNPHIYAQVSDEGAYGKMEQQLIIVAVDMAASLIEHCQEAEIHEQTREKTLS